MNHQDIRRIVKQSLVELAQDVEGPIDITSSYVALVIAERIIDLLEQHERTN